jgi:hypothetical protein
MARSPRDVLHSLDSGLPPPDKQRLPLVAQTNGLKGMSENTRAMVVETGRDWSRRRNSRPGVYALSRSTARRNQTSPAWSRPFA